MRRLEVTFAGYWYTALTIGLGVVALMSANNVLYLIESLLLSGMIFSGVLSERSVAALEIEFRRSPAHAGAAHYDVVRVKNRSRFTLFCVEIGEWRDEGFFCSAYLPRIEPRAELLVSSKMEFRHRGIHRWQGVAVATSYPFGLARKVRILGGPGERLIWPEKCSSQSSRTASGDQGAGGRAGQEFSEGEVRAYTYEDDCRSIVWTLSEKGIGPMVRTRKSKQAQARVVLDLRTEPGQEFESAVMRTAQTFYGSQGRQAVQDVSQDAESSLIIVDDKGSRVFQGKVSALNQLAVVQANAPVRDIKNSVA
ncbi:MAG: DUF58 domain-containing protein [Bdellovibrionia bacterium]